MPSSILMIAALYLVLPTLALGASIPPRPRGWWGSSEPTATESVTAAASGTPVVANALVNGTESTDSLFETTNVTVVANVSASDVNITDLLQGYDLALLSYPNGTAYIVDENAQVACTGVDECKAYLETVGVEEISCDDDEEEDDEEDEDCEEEAGGEATSTASQAPQSTGTGNGSINNGQEIPETPETPENPNGDDGSDSADTPDTPDSPDTPDYGSGNSQASWGALSSSAPSATSVIMHNAVATGGQLTGAGSVGAAAPTGSASSDDSCNGGAVTVTQYVTVTAGAAKPTGSPVAGQNAVATGGAGASSVAAPVASASSKPSGNGSGSVVAGNENTDDDAADAEDDEDEGCEEWDETDEIVYEDEEADVNDDEIEECDDEEDEQSNIEGEATASVNGTIVAPQPYDETNSTAAWNETAEYNNSTVNSTSTESWSSAVESATASATESWSAEASATESWSSEASTTDAAAEVTSYVEVYATSYVEPSAAEATPAADGAVTVDSADSFVRRAGRRLTKVVRRF